jgi:hypothetical protein
MAKVTIPLPDELKALAERHAKNRGTSLEEFLRETVERRLKRLERPWSEDPFFADKNIYKGSTPSDPSERSE